MIELADDRDDKNLPMAQTGIEPLLELRGDQHGDALAERLNEAGYSSRTLQ